MTEHAFAITSGSEKSWRRIDRLTQCGGLRNEIFNSGKLACFDQKYRGLIYVDE
jgi:hypothetical protein